MCEQNCKTVGGVMTVTPTIPGGYDSPPPNVVVYQREMVTLVHQIRDEQTLKRVYDLVSYLYIKK